MIHHFPKDFAFGTSTSAYQIETSFAHDWLGIVARDGNVFNRTTDHELRVAEDIEIISSLAPHYRMGLMWSKLQRAPYAAFDKEAVDHYHTLLSGLRANNVTIMMVLHHFANPLWFIEKGGWEQQSNIAMFVDFADKVAKEFGHYISSWNTFNEPNLYVSMGWMTGEFPPFKKNIVKAKRVIGNIGQAHEHAYKIIKNYHRHHPVGISYNCTVFDHENILGIIPAKFTDYCYMEYPITQFKSLDFFGMSYYARIGFNPMPVTYILNPEKFENRPHDDMWEYYPQGILKCMRRFWKRFKKPVIITENGISTSDDGQRIAALTDYLRFVHQGIEEGIDVKGYYQWSTWDNFEWSLGPSYKFGLYGVDPETKDRFKKPSADFFSKVAFSNKLDA
ncbi:MAG TPA: family 1 glycosylhydrolase [Chryseosolibacter sp.]